MAKQQRNARQFFFFLMISCISWYLLLVFLQLLSFLLLCLLMTSSFTSLSYMHFQYAFLPNSSYLSWVSWLLQLTLSQPPSSLFSCLSPHFYNVSLFPQPPFKPLSSFITCRVGFKYHSLSSKELLRYSLPVVKYFLSISGAPSTHVLATCASSYLLI